MMYKIIGFFLLAPSLFAQVLTGDEINRLCKEKIQGLISDGRIEITERMINDIVLPAGSLTLEASPSIAYQNAFVDIRILLDGKEYKKIKPSFRIKRFKDVFVALKQMEARDTITEDMIGIEEREITNISEYIEKKEDIIGYESKRRIQEGAIILSIYIKEKPLINFGDIVTIIKNGGGFSIKAKGMAISTGYKQKEVSLRNLSSQRIVKGIVIDEETVEVK